MEDVLGDAWRMSGGVLICVAYSFEMFLGGSGSLLGAVGRSQGSCFCFFAIFCVFNVVCRFLCVFVVVDCF